MEQKLELVFAVDGHLTIVEDRQHHDHGTVRKKALVAIVVATRHFVHSIPNPLTVP